MAEEVLNCKYMWNINVTFVYFRQQKHGVMTVCEYEQSPENIELDETSNCWNEQMKHNSCDYGFLQRLLMWTIIN